MRGFTLLAALAVAACSSSPHGVQSTPPVPSRLSQPISVTPSNIVRMRGEFPPGFEVTDIQGEVSPAKSWGLKPGWTSDPRQCAALADPAAGGASAPEGLSGSGTAGIIYVVMTASPSAAGPDPGVVKACNHWSIDSGRTTVVVDRFAAPAVDGAPTIGMIAAIRTIVEGGNETDVRASTVTAYLGEYVAFVTVVTDPGAEQSQFPPDLATTFLTKAVAALRG